MDEESLRKAVHYLFALITVIMLISGLGITYFRTIEGISLGFLDKTSSFWIHDYFWLPFTILLALHLYLTVIRRKRKKKN